MKRSFKLVFIAVLICATWYNSYSQTVLLDPAVRTGKLSNGFTYYIRHNEEPKQGGHVSGQ
jgi:zinc protease